MKSILTLSELVGRLPVKKRELFSRLYTITVDEGRLTIPKELTPWVKKTFGSINKVEKQKIVRVDNNITCESSLFNELRANRPLDAKSDSKIAKFIKRKEGGPFCKPEKSTPEDTFGRIKGKKSITASNIAKYDAMHGLVIFKEHNPLKISHDKIIDYFNTAHEWVKRAYKEDPTRKYPFIMWNCLWKAGASIVHGHLQVVIGKNKHYGEIQKLKRFVEGYMNVYGTNYLDDKFNVHKSLGLGFEKKSARVFAHLTPKKEKETIIFCRQYKSLSEAIYRVLRAYLKVGVQSFDVGIYMPPMDGSWDIPFIAKIVDRGSLANSITDIGAMEFFAGTNIIESDPFKVIDKIKKEF